MSWSYAELSHVAKKYGGPEAFVEAIWTKAYQKAYQDLWTEVFFAAEAYRKGLWTGVLSAAGFAVIVKAIQNKERIALLYNSAFQRITDADEEYATSKEVLVQGEKDYDKEYSEGTSEVEVIDLKSAVTNRDTSL